MPRHLPAVLDALADWPARHADFAFPMTPREQAAEEYLRSTRGWYALGVEVPPELRARVRRLWKARLDLRWGQLRYLALFYPCPEFSSLYVRAARRGRRGDHAAWLHAYPWMKDHLRHDVVRLARQWDRPFAAVDACLLWARHLGGGDEAYRTLARVVVREDVRQARRELPSDFLRHDLTSHGTLTHAEAARVNRFLIEIPNGTTFYEAATGGDPPAGWSCQTDGPRPWRGQQLERAVLASHGFAAQAWGEADERFHAGLLAGLTPEARQRFAGAEAVIGRVRALARA
jgi:hypothetical protein